MEGDAAVLDLVEGAHEDLLTGHNAQGVAHKVVLNLILTDAQDLRVHLAAGTMVEFIEDAAAQVGFGDLQLALREDVGALGLQHVVAVDRLQNGQHRRAAVALAVGIDQGLTGVRRGGGAAHKEEVGYRAQAVHEDLLRLRAGFKQNHAHIALVVCEDLFHAAEIAVHPVQDLPQVRLGADVLHNPHADVLNAAGIHGHDAHGAAGIAVVAILAVRGGADDFGAGKGFLQSSLRAFVGAGGKEQQQLRLKLRQGLPGLPGHVPAVRSLDGKCFNCQCLSRLYYKFSDTSNDNAKLSGNFPDLLHGSRIIGRYRCKLIHGDSL